MGAISFTIDLQLVQELRRHLPFTTFVETGTFRGETLDLVQHLFDECLSVELSRAHYETALQRFAKTPQVRLFHGDSAAFLRDNRPLYASKPTLFWLDAHWCVEGESGEKSQCPLLDELSAIESLNEQSALLIDDARLFLAPPPKPHEISDWPDLDSVLQRLHGLSHGHAVTCFNDVILFVPRAVHARLRPFLQQRGVDLLGLSDKARHYEDVLAQAQAKEPQIHAKEAEIQSKEREIQAKESEIKALKKVADEREQLIIVETHSIEGLQVQLSRLEKEIAAKDAEISRLRSSLAEAEHLKKQLAEREASLQSLRNVLDERENVIRRLTAQPPQQPKKSLRDRIFKKVVEDYWMQIGLLRHYEPRPIKWDKLPKPRLPVARLPQIAIVTPSFNQAAFLESTLLSVLNQKYPKLLFAVQDGGSKDGSRQIIARYADRLTHWESASDGGQAHAIEKGFARIASKLAPEDIMAWLNSDDLVSPRALRFVAEFFARHPGVDVVYGHRIIIDGEDREVARWILPRHEPGALEWIDYVPQETLFWRKRAWDRVGGVDQSFHFALDWDLLARFTEARLRVVRLPYFLGCFRLHQEQKTSCHIHSTGAEEMARIRSRFHGPERQNDMKTIDAWARRIRLRGALTARLLALGLRW